MPDEARRVLIVDDDRPTRALIVELLDAEGYDARAAGRGSDALALLHAWRPDLIMLDLSLGDMGGAAFRAAQQAIPSAADVPVVLLSGSSRVEEAGRHLGVAAAVRKPFDIDDLLSVVERTVAGRGAHGRSRLIPLAGGAPAGQLLLADDAIPGSGPQPAGGTYDCSRRYRP